MKKIFSIIAVVIVAITNLSAQSTKTLYFEKHNTNDVLPLKYNMNRIRGGISCTTLNADMRKLYTNIQRTEYYLADTTIGSLMTPALMLSLKVPDTDFKLFGFLEGTVGHDTELLAIVSSDGKIHDYIVAGISTMDIKLCEFDITEDLEIITYDLLAVDKNKSVGMYDFKSVKLYRVDTTYKITKDGRFWITKYQEYAPQTYTYEQLSDNNYHICNGNETPVR